MSKSAIRKQNIDAIAKFLKNGGTIEVVKSRKEPKKLTASTGSVKHCGRTNAFGIRI